MSNSQLPKLFYQEEMRVKNVALKGWRVGGGRGVALKWWWWEKMQY